MRAILACLYLLTAGAHVAAAHAMPLSFAGVPVQTSSASRPGEAAASDAHRPIAIVLSANSQTGLALLDELIAAGFRGEGATIYALGGTGPSLVARYVPRLPDARWETGAIFPVLNHLGTSVLPSVYGILSNGAPAWRHAGAAQNSEELVLRMLDWIALRSPPFAAQVIQAQPELDAQQAVSTLLETAP